MSNMANVYDFTGRRVLVTGGGKGIGLGIVKKFLQFNATVIAIDIDEGSLQSLAKEHPTVITVKADLSSWEDTTRAVESVLPIHHLVNNAGIMSRKSFLNLKEDDIDKVFSINFKSCVNVSQIVVQSMITNKIENASIVNISSPADTKHLAGAGTDMYGCSKAAVTCLTKVMASELSPLGIRVNYIRPCGVNTEMLHILPEEIQERVIRPGIARSLNHRLIEVGEIADGVVFLSSKMASMVTGTCLDIAAGFDL